MQHERIRTEVFESSHAASKAVADKIVELVGARAAEGRSAVLGLATGHTPIEIYRELIRMHRDEGLDLGNVVTFNLDEYWPMDHDAIQGYTRWMHENFFNHVNIPPENIHIPDGRVDAEKIDDSCAAYESAIARAGGIDLQILGIGRTGHIGFNEPGSSRKGRTRRVALDRVTRLDAASDFFGEENVPREAVTMGIGTIMEAGTICLLAFGEHKAPIVRRTVEGEVTSRVAASFLQEHSDTTFYVGPAAAAHLTRVATPWLVGPCPWDRALTRRAVIWLSQKLDKAVLALTNEDYGENHLQDLLTARGGAYDVNLEVFKRLMDTITGWPGGKEPGKTILVFSPHPDDDVISMGATLRRLVQQGHDVHVAYQTSGNIAVFDHAALRQAEFVEQFNAIFSLAAPGIERIKQFLQTKQAGVVDSDEVQAVKTLIRKIEAIAAAKFCGVPRENCHFLNMPFYETGAVQKLPVSHKDVAISLDVIRRIGPDMVFAAGDLSDPHGTHRMCLQAVLPALEHYETEIGHMPAVWLYRGAWQEWAPHQIDMAVPISPDELYHKRHAIFRHESQKDRAMFPGPYDSREFWQRAEERNRSTAGAYDKLGLPEYHGIEAFVRWTGRRGPDCSEAEAG